MRPLRIGEARIGEAVLGHDVTGTDRHDQVPDTGHGSKLRTPSTTLMGIIAGLVGLAVFLVLHAVWIVPIWYVVPIGIPAAAIGGAAAGWAFTHVGPTLPRGLVARWLAVAVGTIVILTPTLLLIWLRGPLIPIVDGSAQPVASADVPALIGRFVVELVVMTGVTGAVLGWLITRRLRGSVAVSAAAVAFALGPGHNIPFFPLTGDFPATKTGLLLVLAVVVSSSAALVVLDRASGSGSDVDGRPSRDFTG